MNELNPTNAFGELLLDLIEGQFNGDIDAGIQALMESTGKTEEEVVGIIQGDIIVENEDLLSSIIQAFPDADDEDVTMIVNVATAVDEQDRQDLINEIEATESTMDGDEADPSGGAMEGDDSGMMDDAGMETEPQAAGYAYDPRYTANFTGNTMQDKVRQLEQKLANFEAYNYVATELRNLDVFASRAVDAGSLPPSYKALLVGNFSDDSQRVAKFSQIATDNNVDVNTMLFATKYALGLLTDAADFVEFRDVAVTDEDVMMANFSASLDAQVTADLEAIFGN